ncbi:hypothetical protein [Sphingomonas jeddahensis]|uniref:hypothetical protein n=1 Tax=Sphingomonas jeddahensis TaxID=1915074 RepID=UPI0009F932F1|nr:hypothetical protein [Sphingomonas jeddahensis]
MTEQEASICRPILIGWSLAAIVLTLAMADSIITLRFIDPDDAMRLMEACDWLAGQSWWDVSQHRLNSGDFPMHWSRLVDLPLAAGLALTAPLGGAAAIRITMVVVPLVSLLTAMALVAQITRRLAGTDRARYAVLLVPLSASLVYQLRPMRIDHHGWQIVLALAATALLLAQPSRRVGALAGLALAALLTISLEGMPIAASIAGVAALAWAWQPHRRGHLLALVWSLFGGALLLHLVTRGPAFFAPACDAIAPGWLAMLGTAAIGTSLATLAQPTTVAIRIAALATAGAATAATLALVSPACLAGPFATLPPLVHDIWYVGVSEGRPLWEQTADWAAMTIGLPLVGLIATAHAWRCATGEAKLRWALLLLLLASATLVAIMVNRAGATANALAIPGAATLLAALLHRARAIPSLGKRLAATAGAFLLASPGQVAAIGVVAAKTLTPADGTRPSEGQHVPPCERVGDVRVIDRLPAGMIFAPIDIGPDIIATTHHQALAGGYHRAPRPMDVVLEAFTGPPETARRLILASGADYLAGCPGFNETEIYRRDHPDGLWARLERGERFDWLQPIATGTPALAWRVIRPLPSPNPRP